MSSSGSESPNLFPMLDDRPLPDLESDAGNGDDELTILDQQVRGHREPERRATESVVRMCALPVFKSLRHCLETLSSAIRPRNSFW